MSTVTSTLTPPATRSVRHRHPVGRATLGSGAVAAAATTALAAAVQAGGVPLTIDGETIPLVGFAQMTLVGALLGGLLAAALDRYSSQPRRWFVGTAVLLTIVSCAPSVAMPPDRDTRIWLVGTHVLAAAIIVPVVARRIRR